MDTFSESLFNENIPLQKEIHTTFALLFSSRKLDWKLWLRR